MQKILAELKLPADDFKEYCSKLKNYIYVDEVDDLKEGAFIRYISMENDFKLLAPCIYCDLRITADGMQLFCKSLFGRNFFHVHLDRNLVFRKLTKDETVVLAAQKMLAKNK